MKVYKFPSPTGVLYLLMIIYILTKMKKVSVPYWGSLSSNFKSAIKEWFSAQKMFPSPTGVLSLLMHSS